MKSEKETNLKEEDKKLEKVNESSDGSLTREKNIEKTETSLTDKEKKKQKKQEDHKKQKNANKEYRKTLLGQKKVVQIVLILITLLQMEVIFHNNTL